MSNDRVMNQTKLLLENAREEYSDALTVLMMVSTGMLPATVEDVMYAYMVASDWCDNLKNPDSSVANPVFPQKGGYSMELAMIKDYADDLGKMLIQNESKVEIVFKTLSPQLVSFWKSVNPTLRRETQMFHRSLRFTAKLFEEAAGNNRFNEILEEKRVPSMCEVNKYRNHLE